VSQGNKYAPALEVLERTLSFPCEYVIKAFGPCTPEFEACVLARAKDALSAECVRLQGVKTTRSGDRMSVSVALSVESAEQIVGAYASMSGCTGLITLM
jgi:putative lipoic acid-binding regulatory protein